MHSCGGESSQAWPGQVGAWHCKSLDGSGPGQLAGQAGVLPAQLDLSGRLQLLRPPWLSALSWALSAATACSSHVDTDKGFPPTQATHTNPVDSSGNLSSLGHHKMLASKLTSPGTHLLLLSWAVLQSRGVVTLTTTAITCYKTPPCTPSTTSHVNLVLYKGITQPLGTP